MGTGENGCGGDQFDNQNGVIVDGPPKLPWKTPAAASPVVATDSESWPALSDSQQRVKTNGCVDSSFSKSVWPAQVEVDGYGGALPAAEPDKETAATTEQQKFHGRVHMKSPRKPYPMHQNKNVPKHGPNGATLFPVPLPYYQSIVTPVFPTIVPMAPIPAPGYAYQFPPGPLPKVNTQLVMTLLHKHLCLQQMVVSSLHPAMIQILDSKSIGGRLNATVQGFVDGSSFPGPPGYFPAAP